MTVSSVVSRPIPRGLELCSPRQILPFLHRQLVTRSSTAQLLPLLPVYVRMYLCESLCTTHSLTLAYSPLTIIINQTELETKFSMFVQ